MRFVFVLSALAVLGGCRFEASQEAPSPSSPDVAAQAPAPPPPPAAPRPTGAEPAATPDGQPEVVLYVTEWCPYCAQAREFMASEDVPHRVVDIEKDPAGAREYAARGGTGSIPLVAVGDQTMQGWSPVQARSMLDAAGYD